MELLLGDGVDALGWSVCVGYNSSIDQLMSGEGSQYFFGFIGVASALIFANLGAAYGSAKAGVGICSMGVLKP